MADTLRARLVTAAQDHQGDFTSDWLSWGGSDSGVLSPASPPPRSEAGASRPQVKRERQAGAEPGEESHVPPASPSQSLLPTPCSHAATYRRPDTTLVCLDCAAICQPGASPWAAQQIMYCPEGHHVWYPRCDGDGGMRQCSKCPQVQDAQAAAESGGDRWRAGGSV